ncbi:hypothetical protein AB0B48_09120 [Micromonospora sp. NPDC049089]|uniref:hypothetical protein n=1 Tax=Micromonospora sp. NPDC049089 TaxID=3155496 RepID=UPI0033E68505
MITTLPTIPIITLDIYNQDRIVVGRMTVPYEPISDHLVITPSAYLSEGAPRLASTFAVTHLPTGRRIGARACLNCCRTVGQQLADIPGIDWNTTTTGDDFKALVGKATFNEVAATSRKLLSCLSEACDDESEW